MKKLLFTFIVASAMSSVAFAQVSVGLRAGLNISNVKSEFGDESDSGDAKPGFFAGAYLTGNLSEKLAVQPELYFSSVGTKEDDTKMNLGYITIPVFLRYNINDMLNVHLGPQFGILASAKVKEDGESEDIKDSLKGLDVGGTLGLGLDFGPINAGARYYLGLSNISDAPETILGEVTMKNSSFQIFVGYRLFGGE